MSWPLYQGMSDIDVNSIVAYLRSIPAVEHKVPNAVDPRNKGALHIRAFRLVSKQQSLAA